MFLLSTPEAISRVMGERIRNLRLARNLSQSELAGMAGASLSSVRRLEASGQGTVRLLAAVALALQATEGFEALFAPALETIAQAEAAAHTSLRRRARKQAVSHSLKQ